MIITFPLGLMNWKLLLSMAFITLCSIGLLFTLHPGGGSRILVAVSIPPLAEFVKAVGGGRVEVLVMVPQGASPHTYEPTPGQLSKLGRADLYVMVGSGIEFELSWMDRFRDVNPRMRVVNASMGLELLRDDPHIWLSPRCAMVMVENIYSALVELDPEHEDYYAENRDRYLGLLRELDEEFSQLSSKARIRKILVYHPAWGYLCRDYGLEQLALEREGKEPTPRWIEQLIEEARRSGIKVIFTSPQSGSRGVEAIAEELDAEIVEIDPLAEDYVDNMHRVLDALREALGVG
ncbi:zinc ABC transporter substrate-binding protein [Candidatus Bathyarchaeota archaeon]|nr:MAG: zinc ABC transporter substrate-binding protein [Candidatus Bathyarchaeota archaeon]